MSRSYNDDVGADHDFATSSGDCAASEFYKDGKYVLEGEGGIALSAEQWTDMLATWVDNYPIISIEDGMAEGDWDGWKQAGLTWMSTSR